MELYDGGSNRDKQIGFNSSGTPSQFISSKNQMFITFTTGSNGVGRGFTANITFKKSYYDFI